MGTKNQINCKHIWTAQSLPGNHKDSFAQCSKCDLIAGETPIKIELVKDYFQYIDDLLNHVNEHDVEVVSIIPKMNIGSGSEGFYLIYYDYE